MDIRVEFSERHSKKDWDDIRAWFRFLIQRNEREFSDLELEAKGIRKSKATWNSVNPANPRVPLASGQKNADPFLVAIRGLGTGGRVTDTFYLRSGGPSQSHMNTELFTKAMLAWLILIQKIVSPTVRVRLEGIDTKMVSDALVLAGRVRAGLEYPDWMVGTTETTVIIQKPDSLDFRA